MDPAAWVFLGTLVGALASIATTSISNWNTFRIQKNIKNEERIERSRTFQRKTILELQEELVDYMRYSGEAYFEQRKSSVQVGQIERKVKRGDQEYAEAMQEGDIFPPVVVFNDGARYWLADGFHRYHASNYVGYLEIEADVNLGTKRDAILYSVSANAKHGLRRTNADKRKAVLTLLNDDEWSGWSDREIARQCVVSDRMVNKYRSTAKDSQIERKVKRGDQEYTVDTTNIGKKNLLDDPSDFEDENDTGYDLPDNVDPRTGEVIEEYLALKINQI